MKPWIGSEYTEQSRKVLILGESWYGDFHAYDEIRYIKSWIAREDPGRGDRFFSRIYNACNLKTCSQASEEERNSFWAKVAFTNLVSESVGCAARIRPADAHWAKGIRRLKMLLPRLKCDCVLILGLEAAYHVRSVIEDFDIRCVTCPHPSGYGVSTAALREKWREVIEEMG